MPRFYPGPVAMRVIYPNGTRSSPFIVSMNKGDLKRFARRIIDDEWPEEIGNVTTNGVLDEKKLEAARSKDPFDSGSSRLSCAHDGRFWSTVRRLHPECRNWDGQIGNAMVWPRPGQRVIPGDSADRRLSDAEISILFGLDDEFGWQCLGGLGIADPIKALARTVLSWIPRIEESEER